MTLASPLRLLLAATLSSAVLMGCETTGSSSQSSAAPAPATAAAPAPAPQTSRQAAREAKEKDREAREAEIEGTPGPNSKFNRVKIGMGMKEVTDLIGPPTDQGAYITGKAWIPFYFGPDRYRHELLYKGQGRLVFAGSSVGNIGSGHLIRIINNVDERGYK